MLSKASTSIEQSKVDSTEIASSAIESRALFLQYH